MIFLKEVYIHLPNIWEITLRSVARWKNSVVHKLSVIPDKKKSAYENEFLAYNLWAIVLNYKQSGICI